MLEVEDSITQPFQDLIERGKEAVTNAEAARLINSDLSEVMLKAARAAIREGERALQRVQPLVLGHLERYGDAFRDAIRDHDGLFESRRQLEDVLYDLDDFIQVDTFDAAKFVEVQAASKAFALTATDTIKRLRFDSVIGGVLVPQRSRFPPLPPLPTTRMEPVMIPRSQSRTGYRPRHQHHHSIDHLPVGHQPMSPSKQALSSSVRSNPGDGEHMLCRMNTKKSEKSLAPSTESSDSQYSQPSFQWSIPSEAGQGAHSHQPSDYSDIVGAEASTLLGEPLSPKMQEDPQEASRVGTTPWTTAWVNEQADPVQPSHETIPQGDPNRAGRTTTLARRPLSISLSVPDSSSQSNSASESAGPTFAGYRNSMFSTSNTRMSFMKHTPTSSSTSNQRITSLATIASEAALLPDDPGHFHRESGLDARRASSTVLPLQIASAPGREARVASEPAQPARKTRGPKVELHKPIWYTRQENCNIGHRSSLYQLKGFCDGAAAFRHGRVQESTKNSLMLDSTTINVHNSTISAASSSIGVEYVPMTATKPATQCGECEYRHPTIDLRRDMSKIRGAKMCEEGVFFRLRFLYKSHLAQASKAAPMYGCLFCSQLGHTTREGDATAFNSQQLFRHLSHHPQPLPEVPGVTILYGELEEDDPNAGDFDLHLPDPPHASLMTPESSLLARRPTAVAVKGHIQKEGDRPLTDPAGGRDVLQFLAGANIVGVEFPEVWGGRWCLGWHDGVRGAFPSKLVALDPPPKGEIRLPGTNYDGVMVTTRWKWVPPSPDAGWLAFDKNTTLMNVSWLSYDSWCWSGMTKAGKVGFFPASHIKAESIRDRDAAGSSGATLAKRDSRKLFRVRRTKSIASHGS